MQICLICRWQVRVTMAVAVASIQVASSPTASPGWATSWRPTCSRCVWRGPLPGHQRPAGTQEAPCDVWASEPLTFRGLCLSYRVTYVRLTESQVAAGVTGDGLLGYPGNVYSKVIILLTGWFINRKWLQCWHLRDWNWRIVLINWLSKCSKRLN